MKYFKLLLFFIVVITISTTSNASECKFIVEHIQFGDNLDRVKEKKLVGIMRDYKQPKLVDLSLFSGN